MKSKWLLKAALAMSLSFTGCINAALAHPELFSDYSFDDAKQKAKENHKLLLVDFTATWCGPCKLMDSTTWVDADVRKWVSDNAVAIQLDVDKEVDVKTSLGVIAMPTLVIFQGDTGKEFDRQVGYQRPPELLKWLDLVKSGKTEADVISDQLKTIIGKGGETEVIARYKAATAFIQMGHYNEATEQYVWLWNNIAKEFPPMIGARAFMVDNMKLLASVSPDAKRRFAQLRDEADKNNKRDDWIHLNSVLRENEKTLAWFDKVKTDPSQRAFFDEFSFDIQPILTKAKRYADSAQYLYPDPIKKLQERYQQDQEMKKEVNHNVHLFEAAAITIYGTYLAAGREKEAEEISNEVLKLQNDAEMKNALANTAFTLDCVRPVHLKWLDESAPPEKTAKFYWRRAEFCGRLKMYDEAETDYADSLRLEPQAQVYWSRGNMYFDRRNYAKALADFDEAIKLTPNQPAFLLTRGVTRGRLHDLKGALDDIASAEKIDPRMSGDASNDRSDVFLAEKKYQEAYDEANKAVTADPTSSSALCNRGEALLGLGKPEDAIGDLTKAMNSGFEFVTAEACAYRAKAYDQIGKKDLAEQDRSKAKQLGYTEN